MASSMRLNKYLAQAGVASRRSADGLIAQGKVKVNGVIIQKLGVRVDPVLDTVSVSDMEVRLEEKREYWILHKPRGYVSTAVPQGQEKGVLSLVPSKQRLFIAGRLDKDSSGLMIATNDGELTYGLTHPKFGVEKTYRVVVNREVGLEQLTRLMGGVKLTEGVAKFDEIKPLGKRGFEGRIHQGWHRQVRRMCAAVGVEVVQLKRIGYGGLHLGDLPVGDARKLTRPELAKLELAVSG